jgi:hypothetical protein
MLVTKKVASSMLPFYFISFLLGQSEVRAPPLGVSLSPGTKNWRNPSFKKITKTQQNWMTMPFILKLNTV